MTKNNAALLDKIIVKLKSESGTVKMHEDDFSQLIMQIVTLMMRGSMVQMMEVGFLQTNFLK